MEKERERESGCAAQPDGCCARETKRMNKRDRVTCFLRPVDIRHCSVDNHCGQLRSANVVSINVHHWHRQMLLNRVWPSPQLLDYLPRWRIALEVLSMSSLFTSVATRNISPINIGKFFFAYRSSLKRHYSPSFVLLFFNPSRTVDRFRFVIFFFFFVIYIYARDRLKKWIFFLSTDHRLDGKFYFWCLDHGASLDKIGWLAVGSGHCVQKVA